MSSTRMVQHKNFSSAIDFSDSWYEPTPEEEEKAARMLQSDCEMQDSAVIASEAAPVLKESQQPADLTDEMSVLYKGSNGRQIEIDILDSANLKKYEKLVQNDLIKSPFKRRLSGESSSNDEVEEKADVSGMDPAADPGQQSSGGQWKKSKKHENDHGSNSWRLRRESSSSGTSSQNSRKQLEFETDEAVLMRRQKQIDYGKNTLGYENYVKQVPKNARTKEHPSTPQKHLKYSRRAWDGLIRVWRKQLHCFDASSTPEEKA
ncbi:histone RNA hairpin-binding protein [Anopheles maculipalpis]|uniref:histone RNA hairpin-binding protein n=1 Tax=Anopheles maculipalpis TaxID=1496333 RepID=UPI002158A6E7|nr:histone RNA hairpin-binding protein [Anopheles maculipalpis]